ncbi:MAG: hypothetical protein QXT64_06990 [Desulfurococcaceae archaeon]
MIIEKEVAVKCLEDHFEKSRGTLVVVRPHRWLKRKYGRADGTKSRELTKIIETSFATVNFDGRSFYIVKIDKNPIRIFYKVKNKVKKR